MEAKIHIFRSNFDKYCKSSLSCFFMAVVLMSMGVGNTLSGPTIKYAIQTVLDNPLFSSNKEMIDWLVTNGYKEVMVDAVSGNKYYFPSPTLKAAGEYIYGGDKLSSFVKLAHSNGISVIAEIQSLNPHFGGEIHCFTVSEITAVVQEILDTGVDGIQEEDFDEVPDQLEAINNICAKNKATHIHKTNNPVICGFYSWYSHPLTVFDFYKDLDEISCLDYTTDRTNCQVCGSFQDNSLVYGVAKGLGLKIDMKTAWGANLGYEVGRVRWCQQLPTVMQHLMLVRALQFKLNSIAICLWADPPSLVDISEHKRLIAEYTAKQVKKPLFNLVVLLKHDDNWEHAQYSSEAISSGALLSGYDLKVTNKVLPDADAYYILTRGYDGTKTLDISKEIVSLFDTKKPVFLQCVNYIPSGAQLTSNWAAVLKKVGLKTGNIYYKPGDLPASGMYKGITYRNEGYNYYNRTLIHQSTIIPESAVYGAVYSKSDTIPLLLGKDKKFLFTGSCLNYENSFLIANLLANTLQRPSDIFGVVGARVSAFFAVNNTRLELRLPTEVSTFHLLRYNCCGDKIQDKDITYRAPYTTNLLQGDLLIIEAK